MTVTKQFLERKVAKLNEWLQHHNKLHFAYRQKVQNRNYYVNKLCEMDELNQKTIKI